MIATPFDVRVKVTSETIQQMIDAAQELFAERIPEGLSVTSIWFEEPPLFRTADDNGRVVVEAVVRAQVQ